MRVRGASPGLAVVTVGFAVEVVGIAIVEVAGIAQLVGTEGAVVIVKTTHPPKTTARKRDEKKWD